MASFFRNGLILVSLVAVLVSCGKGPDAQQGSAPTNQGGQGQNPDPQKPTPPVTPPSNPHPGNPGHPTPPPPGGPGQPGPELGYFHRASLWAAPVRNSASWTRVVLEIVRARMRDFEQARDVETFCPGYSKASRAQREVCWIRLVGSIVEFESSFSPNEKPFYEGNGVYSVGLLALSTGECPNAPTTRLLMDPLLNLACGVNKMAFLIARGKAIDDPEHRGACAYWSTLRPPHKAQLPDGRWVILGKKDKIIVRTKRFREF